ncbi:MAG: CPBP family intramembrane metalloprotease [Gemmatimonadetes bacterium]|nr:CPBP family intramembrane metalloprotease [Gemmatimonadota bacterium]
MKKAIGALVRLGGFAAIFVALLVGAALMAGDAVERVSVQGAMTLLAALGASILILRYDGRRPLSDLWLSRSGSLSGSGGGFLLGIVIVIPVLVLAVAAGGLRYGSDQGTVLQYLSTAAWTVVVLFGPAAAEELLLRGYPMRVLMERWGAATALVLTTIAFSILHGANPHVGLLALVNIALAGLLLGMVLLVTGSLWWAIGLHLGWNFAVTFLADLPVSGLTIVDAPLVEVARPGNALITGGDFGLEGGLAAPAGLLAAVGFLAARARNGLESGAGWFAHGLPARDGTDS